MSVTFETKRGKLIASLHGDLDHHGAEPMRRQLDQKILQDKPAVVCLDFHDITFMDSSGVGLVMGRVRLLRTYGGQLEISGLSASVKRILQLSGIERIATIRTEGE